MMNPACYDLTARYAAPNGSEPNQQLWYCYIE